MARSVPRKAVRVERREVKRQRLPADRRGEQLAADRAEPDARALVAGGRPRCRSAERPSAGSPSGSHGRRPAHAAFGLAATATAGHQRRAASCSSRAVTAGSTLVSKPLRSRLEPDEHVAVERRLDHGRDLQLGARRPRPRRGSRRRPPCGGCRAARAAGRAGPCAARAGGAGRRCARAPRSRGRRRGRRRRPAARARSSTRVWVRTVIPGSSAIARAIARGSHWRSPGTQVAPSSSPSAGSSARAWPGSSSSHSTPAARSRSIRAGSAASPASLRWTISAPLRRIPARSP